MNATQRYNAYLLLDIGYSNAVNYARLCLGNCLDAAVDAVDDIIANGH